MHTLEGFKMRIFLKFKMGTLSFRRKCADIEIAKKKFEFDQNLACLKVIFGQNSVKKVPYFKDLETASVLTNS